MKLKLYILVFLSSIILECLLGLVRGYATFMISSLVGFLLYFALTVFFVRKLRSNAPDYMILLAIMLGLCIIEVPIRIFSWNQTLVSLPDFIDHFLGVMLGFMFIKSKPLLGISLAITGLAITIFMFYSGYDLWLHKLNFGTFTDTVIENEPEFNIPGSTNRALNNKSLKNKLVIFDFWQTSCGVCFRKFPILQQKFDKYKSLEKVEIYAVNIPIKQDTLNEVINIIKNLNYTFPVLVVEDKSFRKKFNISHVPTVIIIKNGNKIVYRGDIDGIDKVVEDFKKAR